MKFSYKFIFLTFLISMPVLDFMAQSDTSILRVKSKMWFVSEIDYSITMMDKEGNQFDHYDNFIVVYNKGEKIKIPYKSNYIFWDDYDDNMNVKKKDYKIIIQVVKESGSDIELNYRLYQVFDGKKLIYNAQSKNPFEP